jgi:hypothetical protein
MKVIERADSILKKDVPETKPIDTYGPGNFCFKAIGRASQSAWSDVRYVAQIPVESLGTKYGQNSLSFQKWFYSGQIMGNQANGNGTFLWGSSSKYAGQIKDEKRHGLGHMVFDTADTSMASDLCTSAGTSYYGQWEDDKIHGIGIFKFHNDDGGGSMCGIFDKGKVTPYIFSQEVLPENFIEMVQIEARKADALSAEAVQGSASSIFRHNYDTNDGQYLFPLHLTPHRALVLRPGDRGEMATNVGSSRF